MLVTLTKPADVVLVEEFWNKQVSDLKAHREQAAGNAWMIAMEDSGNFDRLDILIAEVDQIFRDFYAKHQENKR